MYHIYLIKSLKDSRTYIGSTNDLERRMRKHIDKKPELIYYEAYKDEKGRRS